jgi:uncharacterized protein (UPF0335 family)
MMMGRNTPSGKILASYVERIERIRAEKKALSDDEAAIMAEAKAGGFVPAVLKYIVSRRAKKPQDLAEAEAIADTYMTALGMASETPLFRQVGMMSVDPAQRDEVIEALKKFVPANGAIVVEAGGRPVRLTRDESGDVTARDVEPAKPSAPASAAKGAPPARPEPPAVDADGAETLGREAFKANQAIIANPFPFGDSRRARWDKGWRIESGGDGMGPDDE